MAFVMPVLMSVFMLTACGSLFAADSAAADLFKSKCAMCHGPDGGGKTMMGEKLKISDLRSEAVQKQSDADLNKTITQGKEKMPAYGSKLTPEQITQMVAYIRELGKAK
jgi:cytochrome c6